ncbi:MAG: adenylyl-sulfate kinase [Verrucomicrobiota bacterium JB022]|nr:adenylyl-sulfate kinase [Verrucomicrobiota bacterium JB022]
MAEHIYPEFERMLRREDKERLLGQRGVVVWLYGLSGSGKSTVANAFERALHSRGKLTQILDGDNIRSGLNQNLGFSDEDRQENIRRIAEVSKLYLNTGIVTLCSFITPRRELRQLAKETVGQGDFVEVYVRASFETCAERDPKGLYAKVLRGEVAHFTGKDSLFEEPAEGDADLVLDTEAHSLEACVTQLDTFLQARGLI